MLPSTSLPSTMLRIYDRGEAIVRRVDRAVRSGGDFLGAFGVHARPRRVKPQAVSCFLRFARLFSWEHKTVIGVRL